MRRLIGLIFWVGCLLSLSVSWARQAASPPGYAELLHLSWIEIQQKGYFEAIPGLELLDRLEGGDCGTCLIALSNAYTGAGKYADGTAAARRAIARAGSEPDQLAFANAALAFSLLGPEATTPELAEAETALHRTLDLHVTPALQRWSFDNLYWILCRQQRYADMVAMGRKYLKAHPRTSNQDIARRLICNGRGLGNLPGMEESHLPADPIGPILRGAAQPPHPLYHPNPGYAGSARDSRIEGRTVAEAIIDAEGCVVSSKILKSLDPDLDENVLKTMRYWVFQPATLEGRPIQVKYSLTVNFKRRPADAAKKIGA
jgi:TonB family protein